MASVIAVRPTAPECDHLSGIHNHLASMIRRQQTYSTRNTAAMIMIPVIVRAFGPLPPLLTFALPANATVAFILSAIIRQLRLPARVAQLLRLTRLGGQNVPQNTSIGSLAGQPMRNAYGQMVIAPVTLEVRLPMRGGKGGFGSQLRAAGGKMSAARRRNGEENRDSCRDLNGRRLSTIKQARQLAAYMATEDDRKRALNEAQKKKLAKLERMLGRVPRGEAEFVEAAEKLDEEGDGLEDDKGEGSSKKREDDVQYDDKGEGSSSKKRERIEDSEYIEQSRAIVDNVRSAVAAAMMKKKRKINPKSSSAAAKTPLTTSSDSTQAV